MKENTFYLLTRSCLTRSLVLMFLVVTLVIGLTPLGDMWCVCSLLFTVFLSCSLSRKILSQVEERTAPLDIPVQWLANLGDIPRILCSLNTHTDTGPTEEEYFDKLLPVSWIVETIGEMKF